MEDEPVFLNMRALAKLRAEAQTGQLNATVVQARADAEDVLRGEIFTITRKSKTPPSGDKRDYYSMGPYWWPDPRAFDGLPYVRRDGEVNPESLHTDRQVLEPMIAAVQTLATAWWLTKERSYANRAAELLRVFFLDSQTRMNPNLNFGQAVPGHCDGRGIGIIDTRQLPGLLDHVRLLRDANVVDEDGLKAWFREYARWLRDSPLGQAEADEHNNHGTWYDVQLAAFSLYADEPAVANVVIADVANKRIDPQLAADGSQPHEIARTLGLSYSTMNLMAFIWLAKLGDRVNINLWSHDSGGKSLRNAVDYLVPFWLEPSRWKGEQIKPFDGRLSVPILHLAAQHWQEPAYEDVATRLGPSWRSQLVTV